MCEVWSKSKSEFFFPPLEQMKKNSGGELKSIRTGEFVLTRVKKPMPIAGSQPMYEEVHSVSAHRILISNEVAGHHEQWYCIKSCI